MNEEPFNTKYTFVVKEPSDAELKEFQRKWLQKKRKEEYHKKVDEAYKSGVKSLLTLIGELQSQNAELRHDIQVVEQEKIDLAGKAYKAAYKELGVSRLQSMYDLLGNALFKELQVGMFYN